MTLPATKAQFTPQEYLRLEAASEAKHEFHSGEILAMSGGTYRHSRISANLTGEIRSRLKCSPCFVLESNMRVRLKEDDRYVYPDGTIVCGKPQFDPLDEKLTTIINPKVVIETLTDSTEAYDRGAKFSSYRGLDSLEEYLLVSQNEPMAETFTRQPDGTWLFSAYRGLGASVKLQSVRIEIPLSEAYAGLDWP